MPAPLDVDKEQVRMLVMSVGVREAARQLDISEDTVSAWSARGKWLEGIKKPTVIQKPASMQGASIASKPADVLANVLREDNEATRIALSRAVRRGSEHLASDKTQPEEIIGSHQALSSFATVAGKVHGWADDSKVAIQVNVAAFSGDVE